MWIRFFRVGRGVSHLFVGRLGRKLPGRGVALETVGK